MFCQDKNSMVEMFQDSLVKKKWVHYLITLELFGLDDLYTLDVDKLTEVWIEFLQVNLQDDDAGFLLNDGNVFVMVHQNHASQFSDTMQDHIIYSKKTIGGLRYSFIEVTDEESKFLLETS